MKRLILATLLFATPALAADTTPAKPPTPPAPTTPALVPITLSTDDLAQLNTFLQSQPYSLAAPIINFLAQKEQAAQATKPAPAK